MPENEKKILSEKDTFLIVGAGPSGLFTARALEKSGIPKKNIKILDKNNWIGGKCRTFTDPTNPELTTGYGAELIAHNYQVVLDVIFEKKIPIESVLPTKLDSMNFMKEFYEKEKWGKFVFSAEVIKELALYEKYLREYEYARDKNLPLPDDFNLPFEEFAKRKGLTKLNALLRPLVTGFGYGAMQVCPTYAVFEYMGHTTIPAMQLIPGLLNQGPFYAIQGGFQRLMEAIAADYEVLTEVTITSIDRSNGIDINFTRKNEKEETLHADYLILALSPVHWKKLGMSLTPTEELAVQQVSYYNYPVAICKLTGYPPQHEFFEHGLQPEGFGDLALVTTCDDRPEPQDGRLCTGYINLPKEPTQEKYSLPDISKWKHELQQVNGVKEVKILDTHTWDDYMSILPWALRCQLVKEQFKSATGYCGSYLSFEDVGCVANYATKLIENSFIPLSKQKLYDNSITTELQRMYRLFKLPQHAPVHANKPVNSNKPVNPNKMEEETHPPEEATYSYT
ncbi:NAD(P)-binding protein [Legionella hackeliae]|uniref:Protoporphyrinogen oxidase n=1 Tax=Legionella hackeliae TaxID=449 RepID=A0A0A8US58_LEGHA|nr:NAD(P)-binding protein [Legionella hackeliae]KTD10095.1 protoporphyrinogen oxidase [Legionella hackeliae]CEK09584.1 conserved protein of unknown function [Legionella hackeliae]STX49494.1 protoporphyrinogen oxidase [Legionella hackeliae]